MNHRNPTKAYLVLSGCLEILVAGSAIATGKPDAAWFAIVLGVIAIYLAIVI